MEIAFGSKPQELIESLQEMASARITLDAEDKIAQAYLSKNHKKLAYARSVLHTEYYDSDGIKIVKAPTICKIITGLCAIVVVLSLSLSIAQDILPPWTAIITILVSALTLFANIEYSAYLSAKRSIILFHKTIDGHAAFTARDIVLRHFDDNDQRALSKAISIEVNVAQFLLR